MNRNCILFDIKKTPNGREMREVRRGWIWGFAKLLAVKLFPIFPLQTGKNTPTIDDIILIF